MKNIFRFLMAVAVLFTASCAKEDISSSIGGGEVEVTFTANLPELGTRAYADGTNADILYYNVYDADTDTLLGVSGSKELDGNKLFIVNIPMLKGMTYDIVFWAEKKDGGYYTLNGKEITVNFENGKKDANDNKRDAFYAYVENFDPTAANADTTIELYRPFGQLNAATNDYEAVTKNKVTLTESSLTVTTFSKLNLETGVATVPVTVIFDATTMPCMLATEETLATGYKYLSMNYLLPGTVDAEFVFKGKRNSDNSEVVFTGTTYTAVPVKANYRTNILGALLTKPTEFNVEIEADFYKPALDIVQTAAELQQQIENAPAGEPTEIVLGENIDLNDLISSLGTMSTRAVTTPSLTIPAGKNIVLDLNGYTLSATENETASYGLITNKGTLTINDSKSNGAIELTADKNRGWNAYSSVISNQPGGVLTVNGGTIEHLGGTDMAYGIDNLTNGNLGTPVVTINGGTVKSTYRAIRQFLNGSNVNTLTVNGGVIEGDNKSIWMQDANKNANPGTLTVGANASLTGNVYLSVTPDSTEWPVVVSVASAALQGESTVAHGDYLPAGYSVVEENGVWTVKFTHIANIGEVGYDSIQAAVAAVKDGETIIVNRNATFNEGNRMSSGGTWYEGVYYVGDKSFTIDLNNNTISQNGAVNDYMFLFKNDGEKANTITFENGTIDAGTAAYCALCTSTTSTQKITINLDNVNLIGNNSNGAVAKIRGGAELNVNAGTVITGKDSYVGIEAFGNNTVVNIKEGAKIYQKGTSSYVGSLAGASGGATINVYGGEGVSAQGGFIAMTSGGTINISGGNWTANTNGAYANSNKSVLIAQSDKQYNAGATNSVVNVTGGTFKGGFNCYGNAVGDAQINITGGNFNADPSAYVVAGKAATENNGTWTIIDAVSTAEALVAALAQGGVVTLGADIALTETAVIAAGKSVVLDLNGKTVTAVEYAFENSGDLSIKGDGVVNGIVYNGDGGEIAINGGTYNTVDGGKWVLLNEGGTLTINNATINGGSSYPIYSYGTNAKLVINDDVTVNATFGCINSYGTGNTVEINGGTYNMTGVQGKTSHIAYFSNVDAVINGGTFKKIGDINMSAAGGGGICVIYGAKLTINNGNFAGDYADLYDWGGTNANGRANSISIKGGTYKFKPSFVAEGKTATQNANGTWTVQ